MGKIQSKWEKSKTDGKNLKANGKNPKQTGKMISLCVQGPLKLWNVDKNQIEGELSLSDTKFQPFVVRAHGKWGESKRCLPLKIRWVLGKWHYR